MKEENTLPAKVAAPPTDNDPFQEWLEKRQGPKVLRPFKRAYKRLRERIIGPEFKLNPQVINGYSLTSHDTAVNKQGVKVRIDSLGGLIVYTSLGRQITLPTFDTFLGGIVFTTYVELERPLVWDAPLNTITLSPKEEEELRLALSSAIKLFEALPIFEDTPRKSPEEKVADAKAYYQRCTELGKHLEERMRRYDA